MTDTSLATPRRRFRFDRNASAILLVAAVLIYLGLVLALGQTRFLTLENVIAILTRSITLGITAIGQTFAILVASIDLSVASVISAAAVVTSVVMNGNPAMMLPAIAAVLVMGAVIGLINGLVIARLEVNPLIATLGMSLIIQGVLSYFYNNFAGNVPAEFQVFAYGTIGVVPYSLIFMFALPDWPGSYCDLPALVPTSIPSAVTRTPPDWRASRRCGSSSAPISCALYALPLPGFISPLACALARHGSAPRASMTSNPSLSS